MIKASYLLKPSVFSVRCIKKIRIPTSHFRTFWSNVTFSSDSPVNVLIESRSLHQNGTVPSNRNYKLHEITFIHVISVHCKIQMASYYTIIAFQIPSLTCTFEDMSYDITFFLTSNVYVPI